MMKVAASLYFYVVRSLVTFFRQQNGERIVALDSLIKTSNVFRVLGASTALLLMTACGGGWGSLGGQPPTITKQPSNVTVAAGQTGALSVTATGTGTLSYQWYQNGTVIAGATSSTYSTPPTTASNTGTVYTVIVTNAGGAVTSTPATLTVTVGSATVTPTVPVITSQPAGQTTTAGNTATYSVTATANAPITYQWYDNGTPIPGATSSTYTTPATTTADNGSNFTVTVSDSAGSVTSNQAPLTVNPTVPPTPPTVTTPASQTVSAGQSATYTVTATGSGPLTYQWSDNGTPIPGATSSSYTTPPTGGGDSGSQFTVTVTNSVGSTTSGAGTLTVITNPTVTNPVSQTVNVGQTASFSVAANGTGTLTYQWLKNGTAIPGATASSYTTPATVAGDSGSLFSVTVTNNVASVTSGTATLTVIAAPTVSNPANQAVIAGQAASFSVTANGTGTLSYQWLKNGTAIPGATSNSYTTPATVAGDSGSRFSVTVTNNAGSVTSGTATLTVITAPTVSNPASQSVNVGQAASFSVTANGAGTLTYQWLKNGTAIPGATSNSYTTPATAAGDSGSLFSVTVTNSAGSVTSGAATLTVITAPTVTSPANATINVGQTASFSVSATGKGTLTYQWFKSGTSIAGATSNSYTTPAAVSGDSGSFFTVVVTNSAGSVTSGQATLTVITPPAITTPPASQTVTAGQTASFSVTASGTGPLTYQWSDNGSPIAGATSSTYTTPPTVSGNSGSVITVTVTNSAGSAISAPATLTVNTDPLVTTPPADQTVTAGHTATFSVTATGTGPLTYQWSENGTAITGATSSSYTTPATMSGDNGSKFSVTVTGAAGTVSAGPANLTVNTPPAITTQPLSQTIIVGQTATFNVVATGTATLTYQWYNGATLISGATSSSYTTPVTTAVGTSQYTVVVTNLVGTVTSNIATLTVTLGTPIASALICSPSAPPYNSAVTITPTFSGGTAVVGSGSSGSTDITALAISGNSYQSPLLTATTTYTLTVTGASTIASTTCKVIPTQVTISPITPANQTAAPGNQSFNATASGGATNNLTWAATGGTFSANVWTSPNTAGNYTITATSVDEPSVHVTTTAIISAPVITTQPASQNVCLHSSTTLSVVAKYAATYQWNFNGTAINGATDSSYFIASAATTNAGNYTVTVTNPAGNVISNVAQVVVGSSITSNPLPLSILTGQTATFSVAATGIAPFSYQWYVIPPGLSASKISGATSSTYTTPAETTDSNGSKFYVTVTDACSVPPLTSTSALLTVTGGNSPPTILTQPVNQTIASGGTATFTVTAAGTPTLAYQWYQVPAKSAPGVYTKISGANSASYTVPASATNTTDDQDGYYVIVSNSYGQAVSVTATLAVGSGILITQQPINDYVNAGDPATFSVSATSALTLSYQWYEAPPSSSTFTPINGATSATYTQASTATTDTGSVFYVVISNGTSTSVTSNSAALFVGAPANVGTLCNWSLVGNAKLLSGGGCNIQLVSANLNQHGEIVWPGLISTGNIQVSFTVTTSDASNPPADGFALVFGDPSLGATPTSLGGIGLGLGAEGIPGFVLAFDDYWDPVNQAPGFVGDPPVPYLGITRGETALWENQYYNLNTSISPLATPAGTPINNANNPAPNPPSSTVVNNFTVSIVQGQMTVTMNGVQVFSGSVTVPPVAYMYFTASTGGYDETTVVSNFTATVSAPSN